MNSEGFHPASFMDACKRLSKSLADALASPDAKALDSIRRTAHSLAKTPGVSAGCDPQMKHLSDTLKDLDSCLGGAETARLPNAPETLGRLSELAKRLSGASPRPEKPAATSTEEPSLFNLFQMEAESQVKLLNDGLLRLEDNPSPQTLEPLMRAAHSMKGAARIVKLDQVVSLAHAMEDCFVAAKDRGMSLDSSRIDALLSAVDSIKRVSEMDEGEAIASVSSQAESFNALVASLKSIADGSFSSAPAQERPPRLQRTANLEASASRKGDFIRITTERVDRMLGLSGETLVDTKRMRSLEARSLDLKRLSDSLAESMSSLGADARGSAGWESAMDRMEELRTAASGLHAGISDSLLKLDNLADELYGEAVSCRMRPFEDVAAAFPRMVRDLARSLGKKIKFEVAGGRTDVDRDILEMLDAPISHLLRNAIDHGIEIPERRLKAGKEETGRISLSAFHWAGSLNIEVKDDGRGIDVADLRERIVEKRLAHADLVKEMSETELLEFLFLPGFSTASTVTEISGRGVGLDVVQSMLQEVGGFVKVKTSPGKGTSFHLQLPITLSVIPALLVSIGGESYAFPLVRVERLLELDAAAIESVGGCQFVSHNGSNIGLVSAREMLGYPEREASGDPLRIVVAGDRLSRYAVEVDSIDGEAQIVVRRLDARLGKLSLFSAAGILDNGSPTLIIDVDDMVRSIDSMLKESGLRSIRKAAPLKKARRRVLVVDDSITIRELQRNLLSSEGYEVATAVDGADAWNALRMDSFDLVVTDIDMPRMNGFELVERLKSSERLKPIPVIVVSYKDREEDKLRGLEAGAEYYLTKGSFHDNRFIQAVRDLTGGPLP